LGDRLSREFFARSPVCVAHDLIGCVLSVLTGEATLSGRIVETEAYGDESDLASHTAIYRVSRKGVMRAPPGTAYVYRSYGIHACFNIVAHEEGTAGAVLIRAVEPTEGAEIMAQRRGASDCKRLAIGPGNVTKAYGITLDDSGTDVVVSNNIIVRPCTGNAVVKNSTRIGITRDIDRPWRFYDPSSPAVSRPARSG
jgi:DNA-3-methyladenine glycosylase